MEQFITYHKELLYNSYPQYLKREYGGRIQKISLNAGFTCPNRDGSKGHGGCTFCNNESFSPVTKLGHHNISEQIEDGIQRSLKKFKKISSFCAYFQSYSNTYADIAYLKNIYEQAIAHPQITTLAIATRPDCVDEEKLDFLSEINNTHKVTLEFGAESICNETLNRINRGHDFQCLVKAIEMSSRRNLDVCVHVILGFPWENYSHWIATAQALSSLPIKYIKIHQLLVVKGTSFHHEYLKNQYELLTKNAYVELLTDFIAHLRGDIIIQRIYSTASRSLLIAPTWSLNVSDLYYKLENRLEKSGIKQGDKFDPQISREKLNEYLYKEKKC